MYRAITWQEAQSRLISSAEPLGNEEISLRYCFYKCAGKAYEAVKPYPPYHICLCEGYAVNAEEVLRKLETEGAPAKLKYSGQITPPLLKSKEPMKGNAYLAKEYSCLPQWLDAVIPKEQAKIEGSTLLVESKVDKFAGVLPTGSIVPPSKKIFEERRRIGYAEIGIIASQSAEEITVVRKPLVGLIIVGECLADVNDKNPPKGTIHEIMTPIFQSIFERWNHPFVPFGVRRENIVEQVRKALAEVDVLIASGLIPEASFAELMNSLRDKVRVVVEGISHPLGAKFRASKGEQKWFFFLPYNPVFAIAIYALILHPFMFALSGDLRPHVPYRLAKLVEPATSEVEADDIWIAQEKSARAIATVAEVKLLKQISRATLATLAEGDCIAIPRCADKHLPQGTEVSIVRYA